MNITQCQGATLTGRPSFVRFTSLNDELNRLFGSQVSESWTPAVDVYENKGNADLIRMDFF